jgi:hypothetical protein
MNGISSVISTPSPFVLSLSKDSERVFSATYLSFDPQLLDLAIER